jgi:hypothetical protein
MYRGMRLQKELDMKDAGARLACSDLAYHGLWRVRKAYLRMYPSLDLELGVENDPSEGGVG